MRNTREVRGETEERDRGTGDGVKGRPKNNSTTKCMG